MNRAGSATGAALLIAGMALFGSATPVSKLVGADLPVFTASLLRVVLATAALLPFAAPGLRAQVARLSRQDWFYLGLVALFGMVGFTVFLVYGMRFVSGVAGSLIMSVTPALTALGAFLFLRAPLGWRRITAVALGVAGIVVINLYKGGFGAGESEHFYLGALLVLLAITCEACYTLVGKRITADVAPLTATFLACAMSLPLFALLALLDFRQLDPVATPPGAWWALAWWGIGTLAGGSALWYSGLARAEGTTAAGFMAVMPASALLLSYFLLGEAFQPIHLLGMALVAGSVGVMSWVHASDSR